MGRAGCERGARAGAVSRRATSRRDGHSVRSTACRSGSRTSSTSRGCRRQAGAAPFAHSLPSRDATLVARLRDAGAVIVGKTVATQFAYKDPAETTNPWSAEHTPGGSSSGSAAAVAARQVPAAIGTQTVGSILRPSAFCGVVGLKGAHGAVPLDGVVPLAPSLDHAGPIARSVADAALVEGRAPGPAPGHRATRSPDAGDLAAAAGSARRPGPVSGSTRPSIASPMQGHGSWTSTCRPSLAGAARCRPRHPRGGGGGRPRGLVRGPRSRVRAADRAASSGPG